MKILIATLLTLCFLVSSCKDDCREKGDCPPEYYKFELGKAKNYLWANAGSYWIYKNTKTGELDTQTCTSCTSYFITAKGKYNETKHITVDYEKLIKSTYSTFNKWTYNDITDDPNPDGVSFNGNYRVIIDRNADGSVNVPFFYPFIINAWSGTGSSNTYCRVKDTSISIQGTLFNNISIFEIDMDDVWYPDSHPIATRYPNAYYFWARNVGLVKRFNKSENYSWELIDYKIIP